MHVFTMIVWIVGISVFGGIVGQYLRNQKKSVGKDFVKLAEKKIQDLESRVAVLEQLATDKGTKLADQIDRL